MDRLLLKPLLLWSTSLWILLTRFVPVRLLRPLIRLSLMTILTGKSCVSFSVSFARPCHETERRGRRPVDNNKRLTNGRAISASESNESLVRLDGLVVDWVVLEHDCVSVRAETRSGLEARAQRLSAGQRNREEEDEMSVVFS